MEFPVTAAAAFCVIAPPAFREKLPVAAILPS